LYFCAVNQTEVDMADNPKATLEKILKECLDKRPASNAAGRLHICQIDIEDDAIICKVSRPGGIVEPGGPKEVVVNIATYNKLRALRQRTIQVVINPRMVEGINTIKFKQKR